MRPTVLSQTVVTMLLLVVVPAVHSFFWGCNVQPVDLPPVDLVKEKLAELFPAKIYLREAGNEEERRYSCVTINSAGPARRGAGAGMSPYMRADDIQNFTGSITYYEQETEDTQDMRYSIVLGKTYEIQFAGVPPTMFQEDSAESTASLTLTYLGQNFAVFDACITFFLSFGNLRSSYMLVNPEFVLSPLDWRCMSEGLSEITGVTPYHPVGICD